MVARSSARDAPAVGYTPGILRACVSLIAAPGELKRGRSWSILPPALSSVCFFAFSLFRPFAVQKNKGLTALRATAGLSDRAIRAAL
jgi:hypothetical protein